VIWVTRAGPTAQVVVTLASSPSSIVGDVPKVNVDPVSIWENTTRSLRTLRLDTMRGKFVAFAVLATLFTTLVMTLTLYGRNRRSLSDRTGQELRGASSDAAREMGVWLDQRLYDLRLRASPMSCRTIWRESAVVMPRSPSRASATTSIPSVKILRRTRDSRSSGVTARS